MCRLVTLLCFASTLGRPLYAENPRTASSQPAVLLELFTSEGCSSCPPADLLLRNVNLKSTPSGQLIIGISEHVTYWNQLGWKDLYSQETFTERENTYASRLAVDGPYTPQMVLNGREQFVGSDSAGLSRALQTEANQPDFGLRFAAAASNASIINVKVSFSGHAAQPLDVMAAITDDADRSNVLRGENAGSLLQHVAVARTLERIGVVRGPGQQQLEVKVPEFMRTSLHDGHHLIVFLQEPGQGAILGAAAQAL